MGASGYVQKAGSQNAAASCPVGSTVSACLGSAEALRQLRRMAGGGGLIQEVYTHCYDEVTATQQRKTEILVKQTRQVQVDVVNRQAA